ncbi:MAG: hypothetical protein HRT91_01245 [Piscirickettsiaceae bacterium]|nr:hypothetical protein [Piscirickettsiaceae bacterium]
MQLASQGDTDAQFNLGNMYEKGVIKGALKGILKGKKVKGKEEWVDLSYRDAIYWYIQAAKAKFTAQGRGWAVNSNKTAEKKRL